MAADSYFDQKVFHFDNTVHSQRKHGFIKTVQNSQLISIRSFCIPFYFKDQKGLLSKNIKNTKVIKMSNSGVLVVHYIK